MNTNTTSPISETPKRATTSRASKITPRASKISRESAKSESDTQSPLQSSRLSIDRSPRSVTSKPTLERRSPKITISTTPPEKQSIRIAKGSELHAQLNVVQEDLKKAKEQIVLLEKEKAKVAEELKEAQKIAYEADEKLREALVAQKRAEENSEIEKFRAVELEQAGIEEVQKKELEWQKELEDVRNQHAMDVDALLSTTQELQRVKHELSMTCDAKNQALSHADDATKIAEIHAEKAVVLSAELTHLKSLLDSKLEKEASESHTVVKLKEEIESLKQELEKVKFFEEKLMEKEAFIEQLHVDLEAAKMAESYAHSLLEEWTTKVDELEASESHTVVKLKEEIESLKQELEKVKFFEEKLMEKEAFIEQLHVGLEAAKMAESYAHSLLEEWTTKVDELEMQIERANCLERSASESLDSVMKQLEGSNDLLHEAESEIASLKEKVGFLEMTVGQQRGDLEESERCFDKAREETSEMEKMVESLKYELETAKEEKNQALSNEKLAASRVQTLLEEKHKLISELENSREEEDKSKKAIESLASALHEVSAEARETKEKLLASQDVHLDYESQVENLKMVLKATNEKYEIMLDDARRELNHLRSSVKQSDIEIHYAKAEWDKKELHLVNCIKKSEEESVSMEKDINRLVNLLKQAEEEAQTMKEEEAQLKDNLKEVESEVIYMQEALAETKAKSTKIKETLLDKENQLQSIICENEELRTKEAASHKRVEELSNLLEEATTKKQTEENGVLTDNEKDYDLLHNVVEFSEGNEHESEEKPTMQLPSDLHEGPKLVNVEEENHIFHDNHLGSSKTESLNGKLKEEESKPKEDDSIEGECKMWESCKIEKKEFSPARETELESFEEEVDSKVEVRDGFDQVNGVNLTENNEDGERSPSKQQQQKKKKPLLRKFGSLLKKKGTSNQK